MVLFIAHVATKIQNTTVAVTENLRLVYAPFVGGGPFDVGNGGTAMRSSAVPLVLLAIACAGCAASGGYPDYPVNVEVDQAVLRYYFEPSTIQLYLSAPAGGRGAIRNEIIYGRIAAYDIEYAKFQQDISRERSLTDTTGDITALVLNALGASLVSNATKTALAASSAAVTGSKLAIDRNIFYERTMPALFAQMDANRAEALVRIEGGTTLPDSQYPLTKAFVDLNAYREAGSLPGALSAITHAAGLKKEAAQTVLFSRRNTFMPAMVRVPLR